MQRYLNDKGRKYVKTHTHTHTHTYIYIYSVCVWIKTNKVTLV